MHCLAAARVARNDADLRVALRHIPILPPPKTIDDLVARLDQRATGASAALAQIVQDARSDNSAGPEQGRINVVGRPQSDARSAPSKALQLRIPVDRHHAAVSSFRRRPCFYDAAPGRPISPNHPNSTRLE